MGVKLGLSLERKITLRVHNEELQNLYSDAVPRAG